MSDQEENKPICTAQNKGFIYIYTSEVCNYRIEDLVVQKKEDWYLRLEH